MGHRKELETRDRRMRLTTMGVARNFHTSIVGIIAAEDVPSEQRKDKIRFFSPTDTFDYERSSGYRALLCHDELKDAPDVPYIHRLRESDHLSDGDIVALDGNTGFVRALYRPYEVHHHLVVTKRCNSNCLMCPE